MSILAGIVEALTTPSAGVITPKEIPATSRPSRHSLTYAFELVTVTGGQLSSSRSAANRVVGLPVNPNATEVNEEFAANITYTLGGASAEESGFIVRKYVVRGTCGIESRRGWSAGDADGSRAGLIHADGNTLWRELRNLFHVYQELRRRKHESGGADVVLAWHDFRNDDHLIIVPTAFRWPRTAASHRLHYPYEIEFTAVATYETFSQSLFGDGLFSLLRDGFARVIGLINEIAGFIKDAKAFVDLVSSTISGVIRTAIGAVESVLDAANGLKQSIADFIDLPRSLARQYADLVDAWRDLLYDDEEASPWSPLSSLASVRIAQIEEGHVPPEDPVAHLEPPGRVVGAVDDDVVDEA